MEKTGRKSRDLKLDNFEGPFDLLFHLIEKNEMDIYDIKISEITDQYLDYLMEMDKMDMEIASEFLVTAATLLHIKSRLLLPKVEEDEEPVDPRTELVLQLLEYQKCKTAATFLKQQHPKGDLYLYRDESGEDFGKTEIRYELDKGILKDIYVELNERNKKKRNKKAQYVDAILRHEKFTVSRKIKEIVSLLIKKSKISFFGDIKKEEIPKLEIIVGFLSMLELAMAKKALLEQKGIYRDIIMRKTKNLENKELKEEEIEEYIDQYK